MSYGAARLSTTIIYDNAIGRGDVSVNDTLI